jgi:DNA-binding transcriptional MerR regulator
MRDTTPSFNLKVIVRETGIKPDTLRAWERRYELPVPKRTPGGHRLYSQRDLDTVKWLMAREKEGMRIGQAAQLWRDLEESGRDPLRQSTAPPPGTRIASAAALADLAALREAWIAACMNFDESAAELEVAHALARHAPEMVSLELLQKGLSEIGRLWYTAGATVQQEHFASAVALRRINALLAAAPTPTRSPLIFLAGPPQEEHAFPLLLLTLLLRYRGWPATFLGINLPLAELENALEAQRPALFVLAVQTMPAAVTALEMARFLRARKTPPAYGGLIFNRLPTLRDKMPGFFLGEELAESPSRITEILMEEPALPAGEPLAESYSQTLACFLRQRRFVEGRVWQRMEAEGMDSAHLQVANEHLEQGIRGALTFGDMSLLDHEIAWVRELLANRQIPTQALTRYLNVYAEAADELLDASCAPVVEWLAGAAGAQR